MMAENKSALIDRIVAAVFFALGLYLVISGTNLPPGAGLYPKVLGVLMAFLSVGLLAQGLKGRVSYVVSISHPRLIVSVTVLTCAYLLMWGIGWFPIRTLIYLALLLRMLGESWKRGIIVSALLTAGVTVAFQYGLQISLE
ncbi:MAG TPA: tripartite tricarboxylate transporter TctB family protein [Opitutaceae bacterium]|nr:tripartite tricarboxylate transporter TctB family protein [Opitutaceae bacterium]